ncbi:histidinol-phosphatase (PHP family) [Desulforhopalus singaporensis]|uniref:Histidinol-phosphatase n=1 Tax=Desulforhopalus singaporensis TaxID=91360 RepID=A0A1H0UNJ6_9BACT|nr:histidinol-phosphatase (PHP family) [Desulforhopalus singaporensis]
MQAAIAKELKSLTFLEHMEEGIVWKKRTWLEKDHFRYFLDEGRRLKELYRNRIDIGLGVECGYNPDYREKLCNRLNEEQWDQVGISCHFLKFPEMKNHLNLFTKSDQDIELARRIGPAKILTRYFDHLLEAATSLPGTVLCHLDGPLRHLSELQLQKSHYRQIEKLLVVIKDNDMALEINTSGFRIRGEQFPAGKILDMAATLKLRIVLGSDAHRPDDVGYDFEKFASGW